MKLKSRVILIIAIVWAVICLAIFAVSELTLNHSYKKMEQTFAGEDIHRVQKALRNILSILEVYTTSYSQWDDLYYFMEKKNQKFIDVNFVPATYNSANINFFMLFDETGKFYYGQAFDLKTSQFSPIPPDLINELNEKSPFVMHKNLASYQPGFLRLNDQYIALSSLPILNSEAKGPAHGSILMGYYLTAEHIKKLSDTVEMKLRIIPLPLSQPSDKLEQAYQALLQGHTYYLLPENTQTALGYSFILDISNHPIAMMEVTIPRTLYQEGRETMYRYLYLIIALGFIVLGILSYLIKKLVLNRILSVSHQVVDIYSQGKFDQRVKVSGQDEIKDMTNSLNSMLELIQLTQEQLKYRIARRTVELEKLSDLNRNLFSEISEHKSIETKLREDEKMLRKMAYYDPLTKLPNRTFFTELLIKARAQAENKKTKIAILFMDADKFKQLNDTYGHDLGDKFLQAIAERLQAAIKDSDAVGRLAGDEFIAFLNYDGNLSTIRHEIERLYQHLSATIVINNITIQPMFSLGISLYPDDDVSIKELINKADLAMYYAKKQEGNICYYHQTDIKQPTVTPL